MNASTSSIAGELRIYGNLSLLEMAPVLVAADRIYPGKTVIEHGGVMNLWGGGSDLASLHAAGECDLAANSETQILRGASSNPDLRILFTVAEYPYPLVARRSAGVNNLTDLRGKKVGTMAKSSAEFCLDRLLRTVGSAADEVTIVPYMAKTAAPLTDIPPALKRGDLDAAVLWEPVLQKAVRAIGDDAIVFCDASVYSEQFCLCSSQAKLEDAALRGKIVEFLRALIVATQTLQREPLAAQQLVADAAELDIETVSDSWPYLSYPGTLSPRLLDALVPVDAWQAKHAGRAPNTRDALAKLIDGSVLREALAA